MVNTDLTSSKEKKRGDFGISCTTHGDGIFNKRVQIPTELQVN